MVVHCSVRIPGNKIKMKKIMKGVFSIEVIYVWNSLSIFISADSIDIFEIRIDNNVNKKWANQKRLTRNLVNALYESKAMYI